MTPPLAAILHAGPGAEVGLVEYLFRFLVHLLAFGVIAGLVYLGSGLVGTLRSTPEADGGAGRAERAHE